MRTYLRLIPTLALLPLCSCAYLRSTTTRGSDEYGQAVEKTTVRCYTLFDANAALAKFNNRSGYTTNGVFGPGTYVTGLNESASATNLVNIFQAVAQGVAQGLKP